MKGPWSAVLVLSAAWLVPDARAVELPTGHSVRIEPSHMATFGPRGYLSNETSLYLGLPWGLNLNGAYSYYEADSSSRTETYYFGAGWEYQQVAFGVNLSKTPRAGDYRSDSFGGTFSLKTVSADYRTTLIVDGLVTHHTSYVYFPTRMTQVDITQRTTTLRVRQRVKWFQLEGETNQSAYNQNVPVALSIINRVIPYIEGVDNVSGLLQGFPERSNGGGITFDAPGIPVSVWSKYTSTILVAALGDGGYFADSYRFGMDWYPLKQLTAGFQYNHLRQTGAPPGDYYGISLSGSF